MQFGVFDFFSLLAGLSASSTGSLPRSFLIVATSSLSCLMMAGSTWVNVLAVVIVALPNSTNCEV